MTKRSRPFATLWKGSVTRDLQLLAGFVGDGSDSKEVVVSKGDLVSAGASVATGVSVWDVDVSVSDFVPVSAEEMPCNLQ